MLLLGAQRDALPHAAPGGHNTLNTSSTNAVAMAAAAERLLLTDYPQQAGTEPRLAGNGDVRSQNEVSCHPALVGQKNRRPAAAAAADSILSGAVKGSAGTAPNSSNGLTDLLGIWGEQNAASVRIVGDAQRPQVLLGGRARQETGGPAARQNEWGWGQAPLFFHHPTPPTW